MPAVRQLISIPAGLANMNMKDFIIYTTAGAGIWNIILAVIGYYVYDFRDQIFPYLDDIPYCTGSRICYLSCSKRDNEEKKKKKEKRKKKLKTEDISRPIGPETEVTRNSPFEEPAPPWRKGDVKLNG